MPCHHVRALVQVNRCLNGDGSAALYHIIPPPRTPQNKHACLCYELLPPRDQKVVIAAPFSTNLTNSTTRKYSPGQQKGLHQSIRPRKATATAVGMTPHLHRLVRTSDSQQHRTADRSSREIAGFVSVCPTALSLTSGLDVTVEMCPERRDTEVDHCGSLQPDEHVPADAQLSRNRSDVLRTACVCVCDTI